MNSVKKPKIWLYQIIPDALVKDALSSIDSAKRENAARELRKKVYKNCWHFLSNLKGCSKEDAEDLAQEVFYAIKKAGILSGSYATKINKNMIIDFWKHYNRQRQLITGIPIYSELDESSDEDMRIASESETYPAVQLDRLIQGELQDGQEEQMRRIEEIGSSLPPDSPLGKGWQALQYLIYEGLSYKEIAEKMGANENTVKAWVSRCVKHLREQVMDGSYPVVELKETAMFVSL